VHFFLAIIVAVAVTAVWMAIWALALRMFGHHVLNPSLEETVAERERQKRMGKLRYILAFGVCGYGLALGLGFAAADLVDNNHHGWGFAISKVTLIALLAGWFYGASNWNRSVRGPVPFPPWSAANDK
jgi:hypothetical protein